MPLIQSYPTAIRDLLYKASIGLITTRVTFEGRAKPLTSISANGMQNYGSGYVDTTIDLTEWLSLQGIRIDTQMPELPTGEMDGKYLISQVSVSIINERGHWSVMQDGSVIDPNFVQDAHINISAEIGGQSIALYRGRVIGYPEERFGETVFTIRDAAFDIIDKPVKFENLSPQQEYKIENNVFSMSYYTEDGLRFYDGYVYFDYRGLPTPTVTNTSPEKITLQNIDLTSTNVAATNSDLGKYRIEFYNHEGYILSGPNIDDFQGNVNQVLDTGFLRIEPTHWKRARIPGGGFFDFVDPTGTVIEFHVCYTVSGNPITLIKRLLEHGMIGSWGNAPTYSTALPIDWDRLNDLELLFHGVTVYVSETNTDNESFSLVSDSKPLSVKHLVEAIAEHVGCYMTADSQGRVTLTNPYIDPGQALHPLNSDMISSHRFIGGKRKFDLIRVNYGYDILQNTYASQLIDSSFAPTDYDPSKAYNPGDIVHYQSSYYRCISPNLAGAFVLSNFVLFQYNEHTFTYRFFKTGVSDRYVFVTFDETRNKIFLAHEIVQANVVPQIGLTLKAGDKCEFQLSEYPKKTFPAEIIRASVIVGGNVQITAKRIPTPYRPSLRCTGSYCEGNYCQ